MTTKVSKPMNSSMHRLRLKWLMLLFLIAMAIPSAVLISKSLQQLKFEAFFQNREIAEELASRMDRSLFELLQVEQNRPFGDYGFLQVRGELGANYVARSPISGYPVEGAFPGLLGYFQISPNGDFSTPLLPEPNALRTQFTLASTEQQQRQGLQLEIKNILATNNLLSTKPEIDLPSTTGANQYSASPPRQTLRESLGTVSRVNSKNQSSVLESHQDSSAGYDEEGVGKSEVVKSQSAFDDISSQNAAPESARLAGASKQKGLGKITEAQLDSPFADKLESRQRAEKKQSKPREINKKETLVKNISKSVKEVSASKPVLKKSVTREPSLVAIDESVTVSDSESLSKANAIKFFENEIDPLELALLDSGHWVLFRKVWRQGQRYIQGMLIEQGPFLKALFEKDYRKSLMFNVSDLALIYRGNVLAVYGNYRRTDRLTGSQKLNGSILFRSKMSAPFDELEGMYTIKNLPTGAGGRVIWWAGLVLAAVLLFGTYLMYRLSLRNLNLVEQQQDFVSSVSHELKTPLTSIRMYGEILKSGWADEDKKQTYYRFIFDESERLTRLINNVLALAKMTRNEVVANLTPMTVAEVMDLIRSKIDSQVRAAGFELSFEIDVEPETKVELDADMITQIMINLVDNSLKFSKHAKEKRVNIYVNQVSKSRVGFSIRDFGPGIEKQQMDKIFELFYRAEGELTRETTGTGIGLALVNQLTQLMHGRVTVANSQPGVRFTVSFPNSKY